MSPLATARALAALGAGHDGPTRGQSVEALKIAASAERTPGHWLHVTFLPGGTARITEHLLPKVQSA